MIISLIGSNSFGLRRRLDELMSEFSTKYGELAIEQIDAEESNAQAIIEAIQSLPFLAKKKMVVVRGLSTNKPAMEKIEQIISAAGKTTELIIYDPLTDKRTSYFK